MAEEQPATPPPAKAEKAPEKAKAPPEPKLFVSAWPHVRSEESVPRIMWTVVATLLPATLVSVYFFGWDALYVLLLTTGAALGTEAAIQRLLKQPLTIEDGSATVTGLLLALTLPPGSPWWLGIVGGVIAIALGKQVFGGLGYNPFNPALVGRVFLLIAFPLEMTTWQLPHPPMLGVEAVSGATPLGMLQVGRLTGKGIGEAAEVNLWDAFIGHIGGSLGETSALALLLGGAYLLYRHYITWHIPVSMAATVALLSLPFWLWDPTRYASPQFHVFTGGLLIGALFMATDMVTCPTTPKGQLLFGFGCGLFTLLIRMWGGYPEGVSFAILLMNAATPIIDRYIQPARYGARGSGASPA
ncbi:MAG: RnfABCDGE type electron transport complex subunit D [Nitrospirae bacterium]|nr:RnfABCDGE type electron transport complex subunit D [Nitrospirota bacterium]